MYLWDAAPEHVVAGVVPAFEVTLYTVVQLGCVVRPALADSPY